MNKRIIILIVINSAICFLACKKEYSYEGGPAPTITMDTSTASPTNNWSCPLCVDADFFIDNKWSFFNNSNFYCGIIDTSIASPFRNSFTFFGPYSCTPDSGLVTTFNIEPMNLNADIFNFTTSKASMYYYDHIGSTHPFITQSGIPFYLTIESYIHQTRIMTGRFWGTVFKPNGQPTTINGKFKTKIL